MSLPTAGALLCVIAFIGVLSTRKLPNWFVFPVIAVIGFLTGATNQQSIFDATSGIGLHLGICICVLEGMLIDNGIEQVVSRWIKKFIDRIGLQKSETILMSFLFLLCAGVSFFMTNAYVALLFVPIILSIARSTGISQSKMILLTIYAATIGGSCTLIGTPVNIYSNIALEQAGIPGFRLWEFSLVGIPILIFDILLVFMFQHRFRLADGPQADSHVLIEHLDTGEITQNSFNLACVGIALLLFVVFMVLDSFKIVTISPVIIGYGLIVICVLAGIGNPNKVSRSLTLEFFMFYGGINLMISIMNHSGLGEQASLLLSRLINNNRNPYVLIAVMFLSTCLLTQFLNNTAAMGIMAPIGLEIAEIMTANPQAIVMAVAFGANSSFLLPMATSTSQIMVFSRLQAKDFIRNGWPFVLVAFICSVLFLPLFFPFY